MNNQSLDRVRENSTVIEQIVKKLFEAGVEAYKLPDKEYLAFKDSKRMEAEEAIEAYIQNLRTELAREIEAVIDGNRIDREATRKHIQSSDILDDVKEVRILDMEIEADDLDDTINKISKEVLAIIRSNNE